MEPIPAQRYRPAVRVPLRNLVVSAASATVGCFEIIAAAAFALPRFLYQAGVVLIVVAVLLALWSLWRYRSQQWTIVADQAGVTVRRSGTSRSVPWAELNAAQVSRSRLELWNRGGRRLEALALDPRDQRAEPLLTLLATIEQRLPR